MVPGTVDVHTKIPVTIITGFLGAGKTTLLSRLVKECSGKRIAVIQNEVSEEMGIESAVLTDSSGKIIPDFFELPNGCICCSAKDDMIVTLENIISLGRERIDAIVVETTGIADPCSVSEIFWVDSEVCSVFQLDGIVAVVDCVNFLTVVSSDHALEHSEIGRRQVAIADRILLNKTDIASPESVAATEALVASLNPAAEIIITKGAEVDADWVLNIGSFSHQRNLVQVAHFHSPSTVDHVFLSFPSALFDRRQLEAAIGELIWEETGCGKIFRSKGLFRDQDGLWYLLQSVGALFETTPLPSAADVESNVAGDAKFLFIGHQLSKELIQARIRPLHSDKAGK